VFTVTISTPKKRETKTVTGSDDWRRLYARLRIERPGSGWIVAEDERGRRHMTVWSSPFNIPLAFRALPGAREALEPFLSRYPRVASLFDIWPDRVQSDGNTVVVSPYSRRYRPLVPTQVKVGKWPNLLLAYLAEVASEDVARSVENKPLSAVWKAMAEAPRKKSVLRKLLKHAISTDKDANKEFLRTLGSLPARADVVYVPNNSNNVDRWWGVDGYGRGRNVYGELLKELAKGVRVRPNRRQWRSRSKRK